MMAAGAQEWAGRAGGVGAEAAAQSCVESAIEDWAEIVRGERIVRVITWEDAVVETEDKDAVEIQTARVEHRHREDGSGSGIGVEDALGQGVFERGGKCGRR